MDNDFTLGITKEDYLRAICMHINIEGYSTIQLNDEGRIQCWICGSNINPKNCSTSVRAKLVSNYIQSRFKEN